MKKTFANNSKFKSKNSNTKEALKLKNSSNGIQENLENFQGYYLLIAVGIRVESRRALRKENLFVIICALDFVLIIFVLLFLV